MFIGMDFGTTNSAVGLLDKDGRARVASFPPAADRPEQTSSDTLRSMLAFDSLHRDEKRKLIPLIGQEAIGVYLESHGDCRLLQSFKSYLTSRLFTSASILGTSYSLEEMIALVVGRLRATAGEQGGGPVERVVAGRPVRFVAEDGRDEDDFAVERLKDAFARAGIHEIAFEYEPIAAAYYYEQGLDHDETVLVADFGGGTSDFCLVRLGPGRAGMKQPEDAILGTSGVGIAGDAFDRRIVERGIAEFFGKNGSYDSGGKTLPMPDWIYGRFARWHHVSFLNAPSTLRMLKDIQRHADQPEALERLLTLIEHNLGYHLYRAVERVKLELSHGESSDFHFRQDGIDIARTVTRAEFEDWIAPELALIEGAVEEVLAKAGLGAAQVDRVFLTGGSSLVPAVRRIFAGRFGEAKLAAGGEFVSVATGLAYRARQLFS